MEIKHSITGDVLFTSSSKDLRCVILEAIRQMANLQRANLREANLQRADLRGADLQRVDLREADLREADLREANLREADLQWADLRWADLRGANLREANLQRADLRGADLREADLDFSCWPLWCGSLDVKLNIKQKRQLLYHLLAVAPEFRTVELLEEANQFHRIPEVPKLEK